MLAAAHGVQAKICYKPLASLFANLYTLPFFYPPQWDIKSLSCCCMCWHMTHQWRTLIYQRVTLPGQPRPQRSGAQISELQDRLAEATELHRSAQQKLEHQQNLVCEFVSVQLCEYVIYVRGIGAELECSALLSIKM
jgi:hypothetical protein